MKYLFQGIVIIAFINLILWLRSDCFDCPSNYSASIDEWLNKRPKDLLANDLKKVLLRSKINFQLIGS